MSEQEYDGLTLEGLAQRLEALERENERMHSQNTELQDKVASLEGSGASGAEDAAVEFHAPGSMDEQDDNRQSLEGLAQRLEVLERENTSLRSELAGSLTRQDVREPRQNSGFFLDLYCTTLQAKSYVTGQVIDLGNDLKEGQEGLVWAENTGGGPAVYAMNTAGPVWHEAAIVGLSDPRGEKGTGVYGTGALCGVEGGGGTTGVKGGGTTGVWGISSPSAHEATGVRGEGSTGVWGSSSKSGYSGVYGQHTGSAGYGIVGDGKGNGAGVLGRNSDSLGVGVRGEGTSAGVQGESFRQGNTGVRGINNSGWGVVGRGGGDYAGVFGLGSFEDPKGIGVAGTSLKGCGGRFGGGRAQLWLLPMEAVGKPTTGEHTKGEIYMDSEATLFVCTDDGTPGSWKRFTTTPTP